MVVISYLVSSNQDRTSTNPPMEPSRKYVPWRPLPGAAPARPALRQPFRPPPPVPPLPLPETAPGGRPLVPPPLLHGVPQIKLRYLRQPGRTLLPRRFPLPCRPRRRLLLLCRLQAQGVVSVGKQGRPHPVDVPSSPPPPSFQQSNRGQTRIRRRRCRRKRKGNKELTF